MKTRPVKTRPVVAALGLMLLLATGCTGSENAGPGGAGPSSTGPSSAGPSSTGPGSTGPGSAAPGSPSASPPPPTPPPHTSPAGDTGTAAPGEATVIAVGDIAQCGNRGDDVTADITARLLRDSPQAVVLALGDLAYPDGSAEAFAECYDPSWGRHTPRMRPVPGNHEYRTRDAADYFAYFGKAAGERGKGWYSFDLGAWHLVALNSNCDDIGGCDAESPQGRWLQDDLARHRDRCTLAYWHHPRYSSGQHGSDPQVAGLWGALEAAGADVVLNGHDHGYERFAPQRAEGRKEGRADAAGIRQFVVGTGGAEHRVFEPPIRHSERRISGVDAMLQLRLTDHGYRWALVGSGGASRPLDAGSGTCS